MKNLALKVACLVCFTVLCLFGNSQLAMAQGIDDVYYSSAMCKPAVATTSNGQTDLRFIFGDAITDSGPQIGGWYNYDNDNQETLICPVPYDKDTPGKVLVRMVVNDRSNNSTRGSVGVQLCAQSATGSTKCPFPIGNGGSGISDMGIETVEVSLNPTLTGFDEEDRIRWVWLKIGIPDIDSQTGASGVLGYRVLRCNNC